MTDRQTAQFAEYGRLQDAAAALLSLYVDLAESGDCGHWNPWDEPEVQELAAAIGQRPTAQYDGKHVVVDRGKLDAEVTEEYGYNPFRGASEFDGLGADGTMDP